MSSSRRVWILCAVASLIIAGFSAMQTFDALKQANNTSAIQGRVKLIRIDSIEVKNSSRNTTSHKHTAVLRFESDKLSHDLLEFPDHPYQDKNYKDLIDQISELIKPTTITAHCNRTLSTCFSHAGAATVIKVALILSILGFALFTFLARSAVHNQKSQ